ncbi:MAG: 3-oxoacyl-ACP synthase [Anaerolineae bacterium SM23_ 63]|nr:MAG: 3-oxoacyl-ACP synthase [Anaerolineae bacterium SM23_ 63]HEY47807.1 beta-ketoacyl-ACP synthase II [Anaerolineae bacterium]
MKRRVVITGLGVVTPLGNDVSTFWDALLEGRSGAGPITQFDPAELEVRIAAEVKDFDPVALFGKRGARRNDRFTHFALEAARQAITNADLKFEGGDAQKVGVLIGTGIGGVITLLNNFEIFQADGSRRVSPFMVPMMMPNAASAAVAITYGLHGPNLTISSACATGSHAISEAGEMIRRGHSELMICGGSEAIIAPIAIAGLKNMGALSTRNDDPQRASRPFDAERDGFVMGEGAGVLILESLEHASARKARIYCELAGQGATSDAFHITAPDETGQGAAWAMEQALSDAGITPEEVDYINAHGTSTPLNDRTETIAIRTVFGPHADQLAVSSTKSMIGHLIGAAGAVEAVACVKSLETGWVHPTINYETPDPECDLDYVPNQARRLEPKIILSNSFGFGGHNSCVILRQWEETA